MEMDVTDIVIYLQTFIYFALLSYGILIANDIVMLGYYIAFGFLYAIMFMFFNMPDFHYSKKTENLIIPVQLFTFSLLIGCICYVVLMKKVM